MTPDICVTNIAALACGSGPGSRSAIRVTISCSSECATSRCESCPRVGACGKAQQTVPGPGGHYAVVATHVNETIALHPAMIKVHGAQRLAS
jgi:hypothetical protein